MTADDGNERSARPAILVVEDNFLIAEFMRVEIEERGCLVIGPASSVKAALAFLDQPVSAALLDIKLGSEIVTPVADRLRELEIPFAFLSAYTDGFALPTRFRDVPFHTKPLSGSDLEAAVERLLSSGSP